MARLVIKLMAPYPAMGAPIFTRKRIDVGSVRACTNPTKVTNHNPVEVPIKRRYINKFIPSGITAEILLQTLGAPRRFTG